MKLRILSEREVRALIDMTQAIVAMRDAFGALSSGAATVPLRLPMPTERGISFLMPAYLERRYTWWTTRGATSSPTIG